MRELIDAQRKIDILKEEVDVLKSGQVPEVAPVARETPAPPPPSGGCGCVVM